MGGAAFDNGLLQIELIREIPEAMKPRRIAIDGSPASNVQPRETKAARPAAFSGHQGLCGGRSPRRSPCVLIGPCLRIDQPGAWSRCILRH
jgi:hypothetical protein